jgi:hypothetical protein
MDDSGWNLWRYQTHLDGLGQIDPDSHPNAEETQRLEQFSRRRSDIELCPP